MVKMESICVLMTLPMSSYLEQELEKRFTVFKPWEYPSRSHLLARHAASIKAVVGNTKLSADSELIDSLPQLQIVATYSVGFDNIDLNKCRERGIRVTNTPDVLTDDVADVAIGLAIATLRKICVSDGFVRRNSWRNGNLELANKVCVDGEFSFGEFNGNSVGIVGLGRIGTAIAKRAAAFGCTISYHSRAKKPKTDYAYYSNVLDLAASCQILIVSCSLTEETRHIITRDVIDALGPKGILINIARGSIIDEPELVSALREGRLAGSGLDVFENEPFVPESFFGLENVVLMPHVGSDTVETCKDMADLVVANLELHFLNKPVLTPVG